MLHFLNITCILLFSLFITTCISQKCQTIKGYDGCACQMDGTNVILGLKTLTLNDTLHRKPRFIADDNKIWWYPYHPCGTFDLFAHRKHPRPGYKPCVGVTAARFTNRSTDMCQGLGNGDGSVFTFRKTFTHPIVSNWTVTYRNHTYTGKPGMVVSLICNRNLDLKDSKFKYINVTNEVILTYYFSLESLCACPGGCTQGIELPDDGNNRLLFIIGITCGILLLLSVFGVVIAYFKFHSRSSSAEKSPLLP